MIACACVCLCMLTAARMYGCVRVCACLCVLYLNLLPSSRTVEPCYDTLAAPLLYMSVTPLPQARPQSHLLLLLLHDADAHSQGRHCGSVWRLPLLNNKLYFAAFKSNFLTFFNLNGDDETAPKEVCVSVCVQLRQMRPIDPMVQAVLHA